MCSIANPRTPVRFRYPPPLQTSALNATLHTQYVASSIVSLVAALCLTELAQYPHSAATELTQNAGLAEGISAWDGWELDGGGFRSPASFARLSAV